MPTPSLLIVPARFKSGKLYSQIPTSGAGDFTVTRATEATRVNASGLIELVASGIPRLDYFASGGAVGCPALLVEPAATNGIRNNSMVGAVTGTPGTLPTNWSISSAGLTQTIVGTGTENGVQFIDFRFNGTAIGTLAVIEHDLSTQIVASDGQTWTYSTYAKLVSAPTPAGAYRINIREFTSVGGTVAEGTFNYTPTSSLARYSATRTLSGGPTVARVAGRLYFTLAIGSPYDFTIRIGYPQMEQSSVATSVIPTTTGSVTRNADVVTVAGAVSGAIGQTQGTIYAEVDIRNAIAGTFISLDIGSTADFLIIGRTSSFAVIVQIKKSSGSTVTIITSSAVALGVHKIALGYTNGDYALYIDGVSAGTSTNSTDYPSAALTRCNLAATAYNVFNDRIRSAALYTTRLTNAQLASLTSP